MKSYKDVTANKEEILAKVRPQSIWMLFKGDGDSCTCQPRGLVSIIACLSSFIKQMREKNGIGAFQEQYLAKTAIRS